MLIKKNYYSGSPIINNCAHRFQLVAEVVNEYIMMMMIKISYKPLKKYLL